MTRTSRAARRVGNVLGEVRQLPDKHRTLPRWIAFEAMRGLSPVVAVDHDGLRYLVSTRDRSIGRIVYMCGGYDEALITRVVAELEREYGGGYLRDRTVIDVGANIGTSVLPLVRRHGAATAVAIEPEPHNVELLRANVEANGLADRIRTRQLAVSDRAGTATLELATSNSGDHRVRTAAAPTAEDAYGEARRRTIQVPMTTLDALLVEEGITPTDVGLVWVDTQGHEGQVLAGAASLLAAGVPMCIEYWPYGLRRAAGLDLLNGVIDAGFSRVLDLRATSAEGRPTPVDRLDRLADRYRAEHYTDLLLLP